MCWQHLFEILTGRSEHKPSDVKLLEKRKWNDKNEKEAHVKRCFALIYFPVHKAYTHVPERHVYSERVDNKIG